MDINHLSDVSHFEQFYLLGKVLGEFQPLELIMSKCIPEWNLTSEASFWIWGMALACLSFLMF